MKGTFFSFIFFVLIMLKKDGEYSLKKKYYNAGEFRHIRTDVTLVRNNVITKK